MAVILCSQVEGKNVGDTYTGPREEWMILNGVAKRADSDDITYDPEKVKDVQIEEAKENPPKVHVEVEPQNIDPSAVGVKQDAAKSEPRKATPAKPTTKTTKAEAKGTTVEKGDKPKEA